MNPLLETHSLEAAVLEENELTACRGFIRDENKTAVVFHMYDDHWYTVVDLDTTFTSLEAALHRFLALRASSTLKKATRRRRMWEVAQALGIPCSPRTMAKGGCPWDGRALHGRTLEAGEGIQDWWHEIGHFLIAPEEGHTLPGWGQGRVYDMSDGGPVIKGCGLEEYASATGIWCQHILGRDPIGAAQQAEHHGWAPGAWLQGCRDIKEPFFSRVASRLEAAGLLDPNATGISGLWRSHR